MTEQNVELTCMQIKTLRAEKRDVTDDLQRFEQALILHANEQQKWSFRVGEDVFRLLPEGPQGATPSKRRLSRQRAAQTPRPRKIVIERAS